MTTRRRTTKAVSAEHKALIAKPLETLLTGKPYTPAAKTDITRTWQKFGWVPPSQWEGK